MKPACLKYPRKSHRKPLRIPRESAKLAEFMGAEFGDGGINNDWQVVITLNADKDAEYAKYLLLLIRELFCISASVKKRGNRTLKIVSSSTSLVDFLIKKGAVKGNKIKQHFDIPKWILGNRGYERAFVRGLVDTDGCLYVHRHAVRGVCYKNIGFCFTSGSDNLLMSVAKIFKKFGFNPRLADQNRRIYLYDKDSVVKYLSVFGTSNARISNVYANWKGAGAV